ncbi:Protein LSM14-like protein A isoform X3 [Oopsacas minuta]|uniref:Protein LSM14-like protein A isoform X3 n=1 Tax=Oopsacas minuta TaxID=111878 RepID=A0AAV7KC31_9METZ|nr:Protein LSM14-like protein A isoform X3 [Oopsacas minuta]
MSDHMEPQLSLGSKLTIISKAGIRYEGILYLIDTIKESIALQNVRSFGTEKRSVPKFHPPKPQIFECIVFKASDLQDLTLVPEDPDTPTEDYLNDPAIISSKPATTPTGSESTKQEPLTFVNQHLNSNNDHKDSGTSSNSLPYPTSDMGHNPKHGSYHGYDIPRGQVSNYRSGSEWSRSRNSLPPPQPAPTARGSGTVSFTQDFDFEEANSRFKKDEIAEEFRKKLKIRNTVTVSQAEDDSIEITATTGVMRSPTVTTTTTTTQPAGGDTVLSSTETTPTPAKPSATATAGESGKQREPGEIRSEDESEDSGVEIAYYDKTKSFFDQISTDNPINKRGKFREERTLNSQTFGVASPPPGTNNRRGPRTGMRRGSGYGQWRNPGGPNGYSGGEYRNTPRYNYEYDYEYYSPQPQRNRGYAPRGYRRPAGPPQGYYHGYPPPETDYYDMPPQHNYYRPPPNPRREEEPSTNYVQSKTFRNSRIAGSTTNKSRDRTNN